MLLALVVPALRGEERVNQSALVLKDFGERVKTYVELHRRLEAKLPKLPDKAEAAQIAEHQKALAQLIRAERRGAERTDIFTPEIRKVLLPILRSEFKGPQGREERQTVKEGNPAVEGKTHGGAPVKVKLAANAPYPDGAPMSTVPAGLLAKLPALPQELEYRFVGRHMILLDVGASLVVDFLTEAVPY
jgi:hypothetical protein